ncbi:Hypothetical protein ABZS17G119_01249 [Kosakonia cowanii]|nr:hypothetical protein [Atlantibacter hermannii]
MLTAFAGRFIVNADNSGRRCASRFNKRNTDDYIAPHA